MNVMPHRLPTKGNATLHDRIFARLALGIDFSTASLGAARWATTHLARGAELVAVHVVPFPDGSPYELPVDSVRERALRQLVPALAGGLGGFAMTLDADRARVVVRVGSTSRAIVGVAEASQAEMVVLGRRARGRRHAIDEPNVVERVARDVLAPVLVVPEGDHGAVDRVLVAIDDGDWGPRLLQSAHRIATSLGAELVILHAPSNSFRAYERLARSQRGSAAAEGANVGEELAAEGAVRAWLGALMAPVLGDTPVRVELATGEPGRAIVRVARSIGAGLVIVGKRGSHGAPIGSLGSAAREALSHVTVPVLALEYDDGREQASEVEPGRGKGRLRLVDGARRQASSSRPSSPRE